VPLIALAAFGISKMEPSFDYGDQYAEVTKLKKRSEAEPCDKTSTLEYTEALNQARDFRGALKNAARFYKSCGAFPRLRWATYHAHKSLSEYGEAVREATLLVEYRPDDKDYWWWRGQAYAGLQSYEEAANDFKQCLLISPKAGSCAYDLSRAQEKMNKPCDALATMEAYLDFFPAKRERGDVQSHLDRLNTSGSCEALFEGKSQDIAFEKGARIIVTEAEVNGVQGRFKLDRFSSDVLISKDFAAKLGISSTGGAMKVRYAFKIVEATPYLATNVGLGELSVKKLKVGMLKEDLGENIDGVLGLSFLSRFQMQIDYDRGNARLTRF